MSIWVTVLVAFTTLFANIAIQFYFRLVTDVQEQKRHLKKVGSWVKTAAVWILDIFTICVGICALYIVSQHKGPITPTFVTSVALVASGLALSVILIGFKRVFLDGLFGEGGLLQKYLSVISGMLNALEILAMDPNLSEETVKNLRQTLYGRQSRLLGGDLPRKSVS